MEALRNICGLSYIDEYEEFEDFNIRKFSAEHAIADKDGCGSIADNSTAAAAVESEEVVCEKEDQDETCDNAEDV